MSTRPEPLQMLVVRDPDGGVEIRAFVDGKEVTFGEIEVDTGYGWSWPEWALHRDDSLEWAAGVSAQFEEAVREAFRHAPGRRQYIDDKPDDEPWA